MRTRNCLLSVGLILPMARDCSRPYRITQRLPVRSRKSTSDKILFMSRGLYVLLWFLILFSSVLVGSALTQEAVNDLGIANSQRKAALAGRTLSVRSETVYMEAARWRQLLRGIRDSRA